MKKVKKEYYLSAILLILFVLLTMYVMSGHADVIDEKVFNGVILLKCIPISVFLRIITTIGSTLGVIVVLGITSYIFIKKKSFSDFKYVMLNVSLGVFSMEILKHIIRRVRPSWKWITQSGFSFPSGHSITAILLYGTLLLLVYKKVHSKYKNFLIIGLIVMIFLIGLSRIYFGVHYLTDVLGSFILGSFILCISNTFMNKEFKNNDKDRNKKRI